MKDKIRELKAEELNDVLLALLDRYRELFPDWEIVTVSLEKYVDKNQQLEQIIAALENMKEKLGRCHMAASLDVLWEEFICELI